MIKQLLKYNKGFDGKLKREVLRSGFWSALLNISDRSLTLLQYGILAILISPTHFGIFGIAILTKEFLSRILRIGIKKALIQDESDSIDHYLNTVWIIKLIRGITIIIIMVVASPIIPDIFGEQEGEIVIQIVALGAFAEAVTNPATVYFQKNLNFDKQYYFQIGGSIAQFIVAIVTVFVLKNIWALPFGYLASRIVRLGLSYILHPYRPELEFNSGLAKDLISYGKWIWLTTLITFLITSGDDTFVGWYLSAGALGLYQMAFRLSNAPATEITQTITSVALPTFSKLQNNRNRRSTAFVQGVEIISLLGFPMSLGIIIVSPAFVNVVLGEEWIPMVPAMQIMAIAGLARAITKIGGALFLGTGAPELDFKMNLVRVLAISILIWPLTDLWGITGTAIAITIGIILTIPIWLVETTELVDSNIYEYLHRISPAVFSSILMGLVTIKIISHTVVGIIVTIILGVVIYTASIVAIYYNLDRYPIFS